MHSIEVDRFFRLPKTIPGPNHRLSKHTKAQRPGPIPPSHLPIFLEKRLRRTVGSQAGRENRTSVMCSLCDAALWLQKERNC